MIQERRVDPSSVVDTNGVQVLWRLGDRWLEEARPHPPGRQWACRRFEAYQWNMEPPLYIHQRMYDGKKEDLFEL